MRPAIQAEAWRLFLVCLFALLFGWSLGFPLQTFLLALLGYLIWSLRLLADLFAWIDGGLRGASSNVSGVFAEISDILSRQKRRHDRTTERMRHALQRITQLTEAIDEGIVVLRRDLVLDWWNKSAGGFLGLQSSDRGRPLTNLVRDPKLVRYIHVENYEKPLEIASPIRIGSILRISASPFGEGDLALVITDVTRLRNLEQLRKEFVGNVSHELRTPLTVLRGYIETLGDTPVSDNPKIARAFTQMNDQVKRMQALADDLLLLSRLESQTGVPSVVEVKLQPLLERIVEEAKIISEGKHEFTLQCPENSMLMAQENDIHSALGNLVFNAVRHNRDGAAVTIRVIELPGTVEISVADDGVGIDPKDIPRLTERFFRTDSSRNSGTGGTGLGLAIVKHVLGRYHGSLDVSSRPGHGATFTCRFPFRPNKT